jgi:hypothetical protein
LDFGMTMTFKIDYSPMVLTIPEAVKYFPDYIHRDWDDAVMTKEVFAGITTQYFGTRWHTKTER